MSAFTVVAVMPSDGYRRAEWVEAANWEEAIEKFEAAEYADGYLVAGVFEGHLTAVDEQ